MLRKLSIITALAWTLFTPLTAVAEEKLITLESPHDVTTTLDKLTAVLESKGMTIFARINHTEGAAKVDLNIPPTQLLLFGNPKIGTPLMKCSPTIAIDLPQKMLAWEAANGKVYIAYTNPMTLKARHATQGCDAVFEKVAGALGNFAKAATAP